MVDYTNFKPEDYSKFIGYQNYDSRNTQNNNPDVTVHAVGKYDVIPKHHMEDIKYSLTTSGINITGKSDKDIVELYQNNPKAQDLHGEIMAQNEIDAAENIQNQTGTKAPIPELAYFVHAYGSSNTLEYVKLLKFKGQEYADNWLYNKTNYGGFKNPIPSSAIGRFRTRYKNYYSK